MTFERFTLSRAARFEGLGLHTGVPVSVTVHPASDGISFRLGQDRVAASPENVTDTTRCTRLGRVGTVEHLMSAFAGLEITDAEVELDAPEVPGLDGSARPFVEGLLQAGFERIGEAVRPHLFGRVFLHHGNAEIAAAKGDGHWRYQYDTNTRWPGLQDFELKRVTQGYVSEVAGARTFAFEEELPMISQMGLGRGLDESSALILGSEGYTNQARFDDEPARHKLLDLIGDLYLSGVPIRFLDVVAHRSGHTANVMAAAKIKLATGG